MAGTRDDHVKEMLTDIIETAGYEAVEIQLPRYKSRQLVRVFIDKEGGVTLDDCKQVSRLVGEKLDIEDPFPTRYTLEVSSPGVDRPLKTIGDFKRNVGRTVLLHVRQAPDGTASYTGLLKEAQESLVILETLTGRLEIDIASIVKGQVHVSL